MNQINERYFYDTTNSSQVMTYQSQQPFGLYGKYDETLAAGYNTMMLLVSAHSL